MTAAHDFEQYYQKFSGRILAKASRSLYLSFKFLPQEIKRVVCLFYLLGRALDTLADNEAIPKDRRFNLLHLILAATDDSNLLTDLEKNINEVLNFFVNQNDKDLMSQLPALLKWLAMTKEEDKNDIKEMMHMVVKGDEMDLNTFHHATDIASFKTEKELMQYCYYQASGIAEVANKIFFRNIHPYAKLAEPQMKILANQCGTAMQLINILRDIPADIKEGRCYIPLDQLQEVNLIPNRIIENVDQLIPILNSWHQKIVVYLDSELEYVLMIANKRIKYGGIIALLISLHTMILLKDLDYLRLKKRIKISRNVIKKIMLLSGIGVFSDKWMRNYYSKLRELAARKIELGAAKR